VTPHFDFVNTPLLRLQAVPDLVEQVYQALLGAISDGSLAPAARLTQEEIAQQLAVSRQPVLQALRLLKQDGLVLDAPGRGVQVAPLTPQGIAAVYQVRGALDALAARLAAQHGEPLDAKLIERGRKAARGRNVQGMIDADAAFHNAVYAAARNPLIPRSAHLHWAHIRRAMGAVLQASSLRESVWNEHEAIAAAIAARDAERAERLMREHDERASDHITRHLAAALHGNEARHA
jgi:DNA-binding GntR family transcriptional regulator